VAQPSRTPAQHAEVLALVESHGGDKTAAAKAAGIPRNTLYSRVAAAKQWDEAGRPLPPERESYHSGRRLPQTSDDCWQVLDDLIGRGKREAPKPIKRAAGKPNREQRIVVAGDFHAPFQASEDVAELIRRERGADLLVLNGDLQDFYAVSKYIKYEKVSIETELAAVDAMLGQLARAFPDVLIVDGNHDHQRFEKQLRDRLSPEMVHVVEFLTGGNLSAIRLIAKRYPNVRFADNQVGRHHVGWFHQEGDLLCTHAEQFSAVEGATLRRLTTRMERMAPVFGLEPWRVCIQAHTHQFAILKVGDKMMVEGGCMSSVPGYVLTARSGASVQTNGYVTLTQDRGRTDWNSIKFVHMQELREDAA
jgi:predicted phosphodiesterase